MNPPSTEIELRPFAPKHLLALVEAEAAFQRSFGLPAADGLRQFFMGKEVSPQWLAQLHEAREADPWRFGFAVLDLATQKVIGVAGLKGPPDQNGTVEVAYGIVPGFEGRGFATAALRKLLAFLSRDSRVRTIRAHTLPLNNASGRVLIKNGFVNMGEVEDAEDGRVWRWELPQATSDKPGRA